MGLRVLIAPSFTSGFSGVCVCVSCWHSHLRTFMYKSVCMCVCVCVCACVSVGHHTINAARIKHDPSEPQLAERRRTACAPLPQGRLVRRPLQQGVHKRARVDISRRIHYSKAFTSVLEGIFRGVHYSKAFTSGQEWIF